MKDELVIFPIFFTNSLARGQKIMQNKNEYANIRIDTFKLLGHFYFSLLLFLLHSFLEI